jgi:integrase
MITPKKLPSGRWRARYTAPDGSIRSLGTYSTKKDAETAIRAKELELERIGSGWVDPHLGSVPFDEWGPQAVSQRLTIVETTRNLYMGHLNRDLIPYWGKTLIKDITPHRVKEWARVTDKKKLRSLLIVLSAVMDEAKQAGHIGVNPCYRTIPKKIIVKPKARPTFPPEVFFDLVDKAEGRLKLLLLVLWGSSCRVGEALALIRSDFDLKAGTVSINKQWVWVPGGYTLSPPKNGDAHERVVFLYPEALEAIRDHYRVEPFDQSELLFKTATGGRWNQRQVGGAWRTFRTKQGLEELHLHDIRHISATQFAPEAGIRDTMYRLGHSSERMSLHYLHVSESKQQTAAAAVGRPTYSENLQASHST